MNLAAASDHGGFPLKARVIEELLKMGHQVADLGTDSTQAVDYPDYARAVAQAVLEGRAERHRRRLGKIAAFEANFGK